MISSLAQPTKSKYEIGDCIEFKRFLVTGSLETEYVVSKGKIIDVKNNNLFEVKLYNHSNNEEMERDKEKDKTEKDKEKDETIWVCPDSIINYYSKNIIPQLSVRLVLREIWKDLIFREVKTVKTKDQFMITYKYVNDNGFERTMYYPSLEVAYHSVPPEHRQNIKSHYKDYFGFTTHRPLRNNDIYYHKEIFFSKKCYGELNLNNRQITATFNYRRGFNTMPPQKNQYVCGFVEAGEKGLFYRKWFTCSKEFLVLWTMVCEPEHHSLKNNIDGEYKTKSLREIMMELDTSVYNVTQTNLPLEEKQRQYKVYNVENNAKYLYNIYQKIARKIFKLTKRDNSSLYMPYEDRFEDDIAWMKNICD